MATKPENIKILLNQMGFSPEENSKGIYFKKYKSHGNYIIRLNFEKDEIDYGKKITLGDKTTCNFSSSENFVVLECVNRLLEKGYSPESLTLEKDYPLGHKTKGKLDILVADKKKKAFLMIECKTWGVEYEKAIKKTLSDGGQILSYFQQDKSAQYLCLYTSRVENKNLEYTNGIIKVEADFNLANNTGEVFEKWNKNFKDNGVFEKWADPYNISIKALTKGNLKPLTKEDSSRIFNQFAEILRHNVVSDKPNAFNKLITLLLCKIVDEDRGDNEELHFQWLEDDTNVALQKRLNDLYKTGMKKYLTKVVTDYSDDDVEEIVGLNEKQKGIIKMMMTELRLKKNNEFAFKEVFNDPSFEENSKVLREVVELLQPYQVRYNKKQQFLGDFFELLLNTSIKQEAGQFFTPVPIARFIINSIPIEKMILKKINEGDSDFLPYVIDYAVGSGHFLTEAMDEIHNIIQKLDEKNDFKPSVKKALNKWAADYDWAYEFVYGIEKDYRLVKTAKVSCFLNGDGLARIFNADGLANFKSDGDYKDKLKKTSKSDPKDNQEFEILVANPPYSVSAFKNTLVNGSSSFELYDRLTEDSSEIECLFIERTKQLLKDGGCAGIILPSSMLNNSGIYSDAREILLKYFKIVAIARFGSYTFMATNTNTVTLFLERRNNTDWQKIQHTVANFFINKTDVTCNGIETPFSKYVDHVYSTISYKDYVTFVNQNPNENIKKHQLYNEYKNAFENSSSIKNLKKKPAFKILSQKEQQEELDRLFYLEVFAIEREKLLYFILAYPQKTLLIKANPDNKNETEKEFLGYEFSNSRGHEGIRPYGAKSVQEATKLYDETNVLNPEKVNTYIYNAFLGKEIPISESLKKHITTHELVDMISFDGVEFSKSLSLAVKKKVEIKSKWDVFKLTQLVDIVRGASPRPIKHYITNDKNGINWIKIGDVSTHSKYINSTKEKITKEGAEKSRAVSIGDFILSNSMSFGRPYIMNISGCIHDGWLLLTGYNKKLNKDYLYNILSSELVQEQFRNAAEGGTTVDNLNIEKVSSVQIPLPPITIQEKIVKEIGVIEKKEIVAEQKIEALGLKIDGLIKNLKGSKTELKKVVEINPSKNGISKLPDETKVSFIEMASLSNEGYITKIETKELGEVKQGYTYFKNEDVLFAKITPCMENGKGALVNGLISDIGFGSTEFFVLRCSDKILNSLLYQIIKQKSFRLEAEQNMTGASGHRRVPRTFIENYEINLPDLKTQKVIVAQIEKIEREMSDSIKYLNTISNEKSIVLKKYLE